MVKTEDELSRLIHSAEISETAAMEALALARPGQPIADVVQHYRQQIAKDGADFDHFAFGVRGLGLATEPNYILTDDDILYVDFGCIYEGCFSDSGTTLTMREPSATLIGRHRALRECVEAGVEAMTPGAKASAAQAAMWKTLNAHGITASARLMDMGWVWKSAITRLSSQIMGSGFMMIAWRSHQIYRLRWTWFSIWKR